MAHAICKKSRWSLFSVKKMASPSFYKNPIICQNNDDFYFSMKITPFREIGTISRKAVKNIEFLKITLKGVNISKKGRI